MAADGIFVVVFSWQWMYFFLLNSLVVDVISVAIFSWPRMRFSWLHLVRCGGDFRGCFWLVTDGIFAAVFGWQRMCFSC